MPLQDLYAKNDHCVSLVEQYFSDCLGLASSLPKYFLCRSKLRLLQKHVRRQATQILKGNWCLLYFNLSIATLPAHDLYFASAKNLVSLHKIEHQKTKQIP